MSDKKPSSLSAALQPLVKLGKDVDMKLDRIQRNNFTLQESRRAANQLNNDLIAIKEEGKRTLISMKAEDDKMSKICRNVPRFTSKLRQMMGGLREEIKTRHGVESVPVEVKKIEKSQPLQPISQNQMPTYAVETSQVVDETPEVAEQQNENATFEIEDNLNGGHVGHHPNTPRVTVKENLEESVLKTPETPEFLKQKDLDKEFNFSPVKPSFLTDIGQDNNKGGKLSWKPQLDDPKKLSWGSGQGPTRVPRGQRDAEEEKTSSEEDEFEGLIKTRRDRLQLPAGKAWDEARKLANEGFNMSELTITEFSCLKKTPVEVKPNRITGPRRGDYPQGETYKTPELRTCVDVGGMKLYKSVTPKTPAFIAQDAAQRFNTPDANQHKFTTPETPNFEGGDATSYHNIQSTYGDTSIQDTASKFVPKTPQTPAFMNNAIKRYIATDKIETPETPDSRANFSKNL